MITANENALERATQNQINSEKDLFTFLSIPSVSTNPDEAANVQQCAEWLAAHLSSCGLQHTEVITTAGHPIVFAEHRCAVPDAPTILFYGHYDVQPVDPLELWTTPPFTPTVRDGKVFARGATDDKGQVLIHAKALQALIADGSLAVHIKMLIEGEEEVGSPNLAPFIKANTQKLACDAVVISDTAMFAPNRPSLVVGLRGLAYVEIHVQGPNRDLHSGAYGGPVVNPLNALCSIIASMRNDDGSIAIDDFYTDVLELTPEEKGEIADLGSMDDRLIADVGVTALGGEKTYSTLEKLWVRPTLDLNGISGGYQAAGAKTVLPAKAMAKLSMRLVPNQKPEHIVELVRKHVQQHAPKGVTVSVVDLHGANPVYVNRDNAATRAAKDALEKTFGVPCVFQREGGSIPVVDLFTSVLQVPAVLMGFGLNTENLHSPNEHFHLENFHKGIEACIRFYSSVQDFE